MIVDLYDAIDRMLWALLAWIAIGAAVAAPVLLLLVWAVTRAVKQAWRALCGRVRASDGSDAAPDVCGTPEASGARSRDPDYREAA